MKLTWFGHSCFLLESAQARILMDPYDPETLTTPLSVAADAVTVSHPHHDHDFLDAVSGDYALLEKSCTFRDVTVTAIESFHDDCGGAERGKNTIYRFETEGIVLAHLGDLGHPLSPEQLAALGKVDVLLVPTGGTYTLGPKEAADAARAVGAPCVVPMHYYIPTLTFPLEDVEDFLAEMEEDYDVGYLPGRTVVLTAENVSEKTVLVFDYLQE